MRWIKKSAVLMVLGLLAGTVFADEAMQYNQKTLPNGDTQSTYSSSDGSTIVSIQHKDGSSETSTITTDGTKSIAIQHADGSMETRVIPSRK